jgi:hypothetical protein
MADDFQPLDEWMAGRSSAPPADQGFQSLDAWMAERSRPAGLSDQELMDRFNEPATTGLSDAQLMAQFRGAPQTSALGTVAREAAYGVVPTIGAFIGGGLGAVGGPAGAIAGGVGGAYLAEKGQEYVLDKLGLGRDDQREAGLREHPVAGFVGGMLPAAAGLRFDRAATLASRAIAGGITGGLEAVTDTDADLTRTALAAGFGAAMPGESALGACPDNRGGDV